MTDEYFTVVMQTLSTISNTILMKIQKKVQLHILSYTVLQATGYIIISLPESAQ